MFDRKVNCLLLRKLDTHTHCIYTEQPLPTPHPPYPATRIHTHTHRCPHPYHTPAATLRGHLQLGSEITCCCVARTPQQWSASTEEWKKNIVNNKSTLQRLSAYIYTGYVVQECNHFSIPYTCIKGTKTKAASKQSGTLHQPCLVAHLFLSHVVPWKCSFYL